MRGFGLKTQTLHQQKGRRNEKMIITKKQALELIEIAKTASWLKGYIDGIEYAEQQLGKKVK
jgi:hypothetical protein